MKRNKFRPFCIFIVLILFMVIVSCEGTFLSDAKREFLNPDIQYRPIPFWHLNGTLNKDSIRKQIADAKNLAGFGGVAVLPVSSGLQHGTGKKTPGMKPEYLSESYFEYYQEMLKACNDLGLELILYDDINFPSGQAGGKLQREYPEYTRKTLFMQDTVICGPKLYSMPVVSDNSLIYMAASAMQPDSTYVIDLSSNIVKSKLTWDVPSGKWRIMIFYCKTNTNSLVDYMQPVAVEKFIDMTYDEYAKRFLNFFGKEVRKVFFDDVGYVAMEKTWNPVITKRFEEKYNKSASLYYPALFYDIGPETEAARVAFYDIRAELLAEGYPRIVSEWCERNKLKSIGHPPGNYRPNPTPLHGDILKFYRHTQIPLMDNIHYYGHGKSGFKQVSSAADLYDRPIVGAEVYGAFPENTDSIILYKTVIDLFVRGVNYIIPHGMWYDSKKEHIRIPPLISPYNKSLAPTLKNYSDFVARSCMMLQGGRRVADIGMIYPVTSAQAFSQMSKNEEIGKRGMLVPPEHDYQKVGDWLTNYIRRDYTLIHPESFQNKKIIRKGDKLVLNNKMNRQEYSMIIIPGGKVLSVKTMESILDFYNHGGIVLATTLLPTRSSEFGKDLQLKKAVEEVFGNDKKQFGKIRTNKAGGKSLFLKDLEISTLQKAMNELLPSPDVVFNSIASNSKNMDIDLLHEKDLRYGSFSYIHKCKDRKEIYYFANSSDKPISVDVFLKGNLKLEIWDPYTGKISSVSQKTVKNSANVYTRFNLDLPNIKSTFIVGIPQ